MNHLKALPLNGDRHFDGGDRWTTENSPAAVTDSPKTREIRKSVTVTALESPYKSFPVETLPKGVREYVSEASAAIGCDASFIALPLLCCLARAIGNTRSIRLKRTWLELAILWAAIVGKSGTHKTPAMQAATQFLQVLQTKSITENASALEEYEVAKALYERNHAEWKKSKTNEPPPTEPPEPHCTRFITSDATIEALAGLLAVQFDGLLVVRDELSGWLGGIAEYKGGKGSDLGHWLAAWSGASLTVDRKTGAVKMIHVPRASVSLVGGARGEEVSPEEFIAIALQSGKGVYWLQSLAETVSKGKRLFDEHGARDWEAEIQTSISDYRDAVKAVDLANAAAEEARKACREANERSQSLMDLRQHLTTGRDKEAKEYAAAMKELGVDAHDWTQFSMA